MADYSMSCQSCGETFHARRRDAVTCTRACSQRLRRGIPAANYQEPERLHDLPARRAPEQASERVYALCRGRIDQAEMLAVNDRGVIAGGSLAGSTIRAVLETAAREGWLAYRVRPDGWYSAEWWPSRNGSKEYGFEWSSADNDNGLAAIEIRGEEE